MAELVVDMGEIKVGCDGDTLVSLGLGSCVGVVLYDPINKIAGLAHVMLPDSADSRRSLPEKKVMIAEVDSTVRGNLKNILTSHEYHVVSETDEKNKSIDDFKKLKPLASYISAFLPPTDGLDVIHSFLSLDRTTNAIIISPKIEKNVLMHYLTNGASDVIQQPYLSESVMNAANYCLYKTLRRYADKAIELMIGRLENIGAHKPNIVAKIAGGAHMFSSIVDVNNPMNIGKRNVSAVEDVLNKLGINILSKEIGGDVGRTIRFDVTSGMLKIKTKDDTKDI